MPLKQIALKYLPDSALKMLRARHYSRQIRNYPVAAEPDLEGCRRLLQAGDTVIDVGANIGVYTRFCSEFVASAGQVHSLEPVPDTFFYLRRNVEALGLTNVHLYNFAASDKDQAQAAMSMPEFASGGANIYEARLSDEGDIAVQATRLDTLFPELRPRLIKCDVEGHEFATIEGARELIARCRPRWLIEVSDGRVFEQLRAMGYESWVWVEGAFRRKTEADKLPNYFFFHRDDHVL